MRAKVISARRMVVDVCDRVLVSALVALALIEVRVTGLALTSAVGAPNGGAGVRRHQVEQVASACRDRGRHPARRFPGRRGRPGLGLAGRGARLRPPIAGRWSTLGQLHLLAASRPGLRQRHPDRDLPELRPAGTAASSAPGPVGGRSAKVRDAAPVLQAGQWRWRRTGQYRRRRRPATGRWLRPAWLPTCGYGRNPNGARDDQLARRHSLAPIGAAAVAAGARPRYLPCASADGRRHIIETKGLSKVPRVPAVKGGSICGERGSSTADPDPERRRRRTTVFQPARRFL